MKHFIRLESLDCAGNLISFRFRSSLSLFNQHSFYIRYNEPPAPMNESILAIPFAALMAPLCWATGAALELPYLDQDFAEALGRCKHYWKKFYPAWAFEHDLKTIRIKNKAPAAEGCGMLFSGGLDSIATYVKNREKKPELFVILGADIPDAKQAFIDICKKRIFERFAASENLKLHYIETDMREVLHKKKLLHYSKNWYSAVQFSLMLSSLTAPVSYTRVKTLLVAGCSHKSTDSSPCSGDSRVVRNLKWAATQVLDETNESSRVDKITRYLKGCPELYSYIRVCWVQHEEINCSRCEKCCRTICELLINNMDPNLLNFKVNAETLGILKQKMLKTFCHFFRGSEAVLDYWREIRAGIDLEKVEDLYGSRGFFQWLAAFKKIEEPAPRKSLPWRIAYEKLRNGRELILSLRKMAHDLKIRAAKKRARKFPGGKPSALQPALPAASSSWSLAK